MKYNKTILVLIIVMLCLTTNVYSQTQTILYKGSGNKLWTEQQVDSIIDARNIKYKDMGMVSIKKIERKEQKGDTLLYFYSLHMAPKEAIEDRFRYTKFIGKPLPEFSLKDIRGKTINSKDLIGRPIVINMWFTTCTPCIAEMPELNNIKKAHAASDVVFLAVTYENKEKVTKFLKKRKFDFQHLVDASAYCEQFTQSYPINIFVNRTGIIEHIMDGLPVVYDAKEKQQTDKISTVGFEQALSKIK